MSLLKPDDGVNGRLILVASVVFVVESVYPYVRFLAGVRKRPFADAAFVYFDFSLLLTWVFAGLALGWIVVGVAWLVGRSADRAVAVSISFLFFVFLGQPIKDFHGHVMNVSPVLGPSVVWAVISLVLLLFLVEAWRLGVGSRFVPVALSVVVAMTATAGWEFVSSAVAHGDPVRSRIVVPTGDRWMVRDTESRDIYVVILDGYGGGVALERYAGIDNTDFLDQLSLEGLTVFGGARSLYSATVFSVASMFALDRPIGDGGFRLSDRVAAQHLIGGDSQFVELMQDAGYDVVMIENAWSLIECDTSSIDCRRSTPFDEFDWAFFQSTVLPAGLMPLFDVHPWVVGSVRQMMMLSAVAGERSDTPRVIIAHVLSPHPPFQLDSSCGTTNDPRLAGFSFSAPGVDKEVRQQGFERQLGCINRLVIQFLRSIDDEAVVVLSGDHGSDFRGQTRKPLETWDQGDIEERFSVLLAARLPAECGTEHDVSNPVDIMRQVTNCAVGSEFVPLDVDPLMVFYDRDGTGRAVSVGD